jgi:hypothetical protein
MPATRYRPFSAKLKGDARRNDVDTTGSRPAAGGGDLGIATAGKPGC